jgi:hypothetical protein
MVGGLHETPLYPFWTHELRYNRATMHPGRGILYDDDQPAFREALYASDLRFAVLTPEYNLRACFAYFLGGNVEVKIIHARDHCLDEAIATLRAAPKALLPRVVTARGPAPHRPPGSDRDGGGAAAGDRYDCTAARASATACASARSEYQTSTSHSCDHAARTIS